MKIDNQRVIGEDIIEESQFTQTRIINFIPDEKELNVDIFGLFLKDIPTKKMQY